MKQFISILLTIIVAGTSAYVATQTDILENTKNELTNIVLGSDEDRINKTLDSFFEAYNSGDMDGVLDCCDAKTKTAYRAAMNIGGSLLDLEMADLFSAGVGIGDIEISLSNKKITFESDTEVEVKGDFVYDDDFSKQKEEVVFKMIKEKNKWYISDIR